MAGVHSGEIPEALRSSRSETEINGKEESKGKQSHYKVIIRLNSVIKKPDFRQIKVTFSTLHSAIRITKYVEQKKKEKACTHTALSPVKLLTQNTNTGCKL